MSLEKISHMIGRGAFHDLREGFGNTLSPSDTDEDVKFALGYAQSQCGWLPCVVLLARYASSIADAEEIARCYIRETRITTHGAPVHRLSALLAVRQLAGQPLSVSTYKRWGWILGCNYQVVQESVREATRWLDDQWPKARDAFLVGIGERESEFAKAEYKRRIDARNALAQGRKTA